MEKPTIPTLPVRQVTRKRIFAMRLTDRERAEIEALAAETFGSGTPPTDERLLEVLDQVLANVNAQIEAIDALAPPAELAATVDEWLSAGRSGVEAARSQGTAFFDPTGENPISAEANRLATEIGVTECA